MLTGANVCRLKHHMITYDSAGYFKLWDISHLKRGNANEDAVKELLYIRAHKSEITCADFMHIDSKKFIITGSRDRNLNLYTLDGIQIGIFGKWFWKLKDVSTYRKKTPRFGTPVKKRTLSDPDSLSNIHQQNRRNTIHPSKKDKDQQK